MVFISSCIVPSNKVLQSLSFSWFLLSYSSFLFQVICFSSNCFNLLNELHSMTSNRCRSNSVFSLLHILPTGLFLSHSTLSVLCYQIKSRPSSLYLIFPLILCIQSWRTSINLISFSFYLALCHMYHSIKLTFLSLYLFSIFIYLYLLLVILFFCLEIISPNSLRDLFIVPLMHFLLRDT